MTEIEFHVNAPDSLAYTCRLLRKAVRSGAKVVVTAPEEALGRLDVMLWTFSATEFVPHCHEMRDATVRMMSPVVLTGDAAQAPHHHVLVNLGQSVPTGFERFERLIEVVTQEDEDRLQARVRWKYYLNRGYALEHRDVVPKERA